MGRGLLLGFEVVRLWLMGVYICVCIKGVLGGYWGCTWMGSIRNGYKLVYSDYFNAQPGFCHFMHAQEMPHVLSCTWMMCCLKWLH